jgi:predicted nucleic acid-binding protein
LDTSILLGGQFAIASTFEVAVASLSYAELQFGISKPGLSPQDFMARQTRYQRLREQFGDGLPFDDQASISYGLLASLTLRAGRQLRGRQLDILIAAVAHANQAAIVTANPGDFIALAGAIPVLDPLGDPWPN